MRQCRESFGISAPKLQARGDFKWLLPLSGHVYEPLTLKGATTKHLERRDRNQSDRTLALSLNLSLPSLKPLTKEKEKEKEASREKEDEIVANMNDPDR
ncbi:MAG: hypothetical protein ACREF9_03125 [Opitutaceae bacterium]